MADDSYQGAGFEPADDFELAEAIGGTGIDDFAQTVGQAIAEQMQTQQAPPPEVAQQLELQALAADIGARHPELATHEGAQTAAGLAQHVAAELGQPHLAGDLRFIEAMHVAAQGAAAGVGRPERTLVDEIFDTGGHLGSRVLPGGGSAS
jgi:hypothetical protein